MHHLLRDDPGIQPDFRGSPQSPALKTQLAGAALKKAAEVGAKIIAGPLYSPVGYLPGRRRNADEWKWGVDAIRSSGPC